MIRYFFGPDTYAARQEIGKIAGNHRAVIRWLDKEDVQQKPFAAWLDHGTKSLLGIELLVVRDHSQFPSNVQSDMVHAFTDNPKALCILWDREAPDKRSSFFRSLRQYDCKEFSYPSRHEIVIWIKKEAKRTGSSIKDDAAQALVDRLGPDRWQLSQELEKLTLSQSPVSKEDVVAAVPEAPVEEEVFAMLDALMAGNAKRAVGVMESLLQAGQSEFYILSMLAYQFRTLITIRAQFPYTSYPSQIAKRGKIHPFVVERNLLAARTYSTDECINLLTRVLACDVAIKSGKVDARTALSMLVINLVKLPKQPSFRT